MAYTFFELLSLVSFRHLLIGIIRGSEEPDKYVMYGNHRDSWVYGAVDPGSGTACMMEITRMFGELRKSGWKPRRYKFAGAIICALKLY